MSLHLSPMKDIWNSAYMRNVRRAMLNGERLSACEVCYESEAASGQSYRTFAGLEPLEGVAVTPEQLTMYGARSGYRVDQWPQSIKLEIGNLCNLKCRMCYGGNSSQIERDRVHGRWSGGVDPLHAIWRGGTARIGPEPRIGVRSTGLFSVEDLGDSIRRWTDGHATFHIPVDRETKLKALGIEFHASVAVGQHYQVIINGRCRATGFVEAGKLEVSIDLHNCHHDGSLLVEILSSKVIDMPGQPERGVPLRGLQLSRQNEPVMTHPQLLSSADAGPWYADDAKLFDDLLRSPETLSRLYIPGGEPLINDRVAAVLDHLIAAGAASHMHLELSTNCTHVDPRFIARLEKFRKVSMYLSIDAVGAEFEYIRYPARWHVVDRNIRLLKESYGLHCNVPPVIQIYNVLGITDLFRYCDSLGLEFGMNILHTPERLAIRNLPPRARAEAAARLIQYHDKDCNSGRQSMVMSLAKYLAALDRPADPKAFREFMLFTNDLDVTRGQSFRSTYPDLVRLLADDGFEWTDETFYAKGDRGNRPARDREMAWL
jgi:MoaA/NifB/PqqE/SkfB family radical SAM enzyme